MKKAKLFTLFGLGLASACLIGFGSVKAPVAAYAEPEEAEPVEVFECTVAIEEAEHGKIAVDKVEGHVGELVTITASHDLFYKIDFVSVNGTNLVEDEEVSGKFVFALVEGENKIGAKFVVDAELLGEMSVIYEQAMNKDWTNLFSVENVLRIITFLLNGGILLAVARYFIKDKKLEKKVEKKVEETISKIIPDTTKEVVLATVEKLITPYFAQIEGEFENVENALTVFSRCLALAQEETPEAKIAITQELSSLTLSDQVAVSEVRKRLEEFIAESRKEIEDILLKLAGMKEANTEIIESAEPVAEPVEEPEEDKDSTINPYE